MMDFLVQRRRASSSVLSSFLSVFLCILTVYVFNIVKSLFCSRPLADTWGITDVVQMLGTANSGNVDQHGSETVTLLSTPSLHALRKSVISGEMDTFRLLKPHGALEK